MTNDMNYEDLHSTWTGLKYIHIYNRIKTCVCSKCSSWKWVGGPSSEFLVHFLDLGELKDSGRHSTVGERLREAKLYN